MRAFDTQAVAIALHRSPKYIDNLLSRTRVPGVSIGRQGQPRRIGPAAVVLITVALRLNDEFGLAMPKAIELSRRIIAQPAGELAIGPHFFLKLEVQALQDEVLGRLEAASESVIGRRRGRPRSTRTPP